MTKVEERYRRTLDELNILSAAALADSKDAKEFTQAIGDFYLIAYARAFQSVEDDIDEMHEMDVARMFDVVELRIDGKNYVDRLTEYFEDGNIEDIKRCLETDIHRIYNTATIDAASDSDKKLKKTWHTMEDDKVRTGHEFLDKITIPIEEPFVTFGGYSAMFPGGFELAELNVGCRCLIEITNS